MVAQHRYPYYMLLIDINLYQDIIKSLTNSRIYAFLFETQRRDQHLETPPLAKNGHRLFSGGTCTISLRPEAKLNHNAVKKIRENLLVSKAELARKAGVSPITIDRVERGLDCRMETKRKIILALGLDLSEKEKVFPEN